MPSQQTLKFNWYIPDHGENDWDTDLKINGMIKQIDAFMGNAFEVDQTQADITDYAIIGWKATTRPFEDLTSQVPTAPTGGFVTGEAYYPGTLRVFYNGVLQFPGKTYNETTPGIGLFTFTAGNIPAGLDEVYVEYFVDTTAGGPM